MPSRQTTSFRHTPRKHSTLSLLIGALALTPLSHAVADDTIYPDAFMTSHPQTEQSFQKAITPLLNQHGWLSHYGTASPVGKFEQDGLIYTVLSGCKPNDCSTERYTALVDIHSNIKGMLIHENERSGNKASTTTLTWFGDTDDSSRRLIMKAMLDTK